MPTVAKSSTSHAKLGDIASYSISTSAIPIDTGDSAGSIPTINATFTDGEDVEYLIGENFSLSNPSIGEYDGRIVSVGQSARSNQYSLDVHNIMTRLNTEHRLYPLADFQGIQSGWLPCYALEYWTQQCGIFQNDVPGDVLFYQSQFGHYGAWAKDITRPLKSALSGPGPFTANDYLDGVANVFPRNSEALISFPGKSKISDMGSYLPVLIPTDGSVMVFSGSALLGGTDRQGDIIWKMLDPANKVRQLKVSCHSSNGFTLSTSLDGITFTTLSTIPAPAGGTYTFFVGLSRSGTTTTFTFKVLDRITSEPVGGTSVIASGGSYFYGSLALTHVSYKSPDTGSGSNLLYADVFISHMDSMPTVAPQTQKALTPGIKTTSFLIGFSGNVWEHIKQYCSIYHLDVNYRNGKLTVEPRQKDIKTGASLSELSTKVTDREQARHVEVINYQHTPTGSNARVLWQADSVYQVAVGEVQEFTIQTDHSIMETRNPICVSGITPYPYTGSTGQYVVTGSDGYIVSPTFWADQGGSITTDITDNEGEIKIIIKGPDYDSARAPYRISEGDAGRPALYVTGVGVLSDPVTLKVPTGKSRAAKDVGTTIDSPFIGNPKHAYDAAVRAAKAYATPDVSVSVSEPVGYDQTSKLGTIPAGSLVKLQGNILRVNNVNQSHTSLSGEAAQHNTIYQLKRSFSGQTIEDMNTYYASKPIGKVNLKPMKELK